MSPGLAAALSLTTRRRRRAAGERIAELFVQHGRMVYGVCRLILRDATDAEDAAQQTFLSAYRGLLAGQEPREPSAWLGTIARNECRARLRSRSAEPLTLVTEPASDETQREVGRRAEAEALCSALAELPPQQRDAIVLREFYGLSYAEVAAALGLTGAAVETLLFRSRRRLQEQLRPLRAALGVLTLPPSLSESLAQSLPGFGGSAAGAGVGAGVLAKLGSTSFGAKLAAGALALGTAGTVAGLERESHHRAHHQGPVAARQQAAHAKLVRVEVPGPAPIAPAPPSSSESGRSESVALREKRNEPEQHSGSSESSGRQGSDGESGTSSHEGSSGSSGSESNHESGSGDRGTSGGGETADSGVDSGSSGGDGLQPPGDSGSPGGDSSSTGSDGGGD